jgi:SAM-dependent methyltransferase
MSSPDWDDLRLTLQQHQYMSGVERDAERVRATAEIFTPSELVVEMLARFDLTKLGPGCRVLDPACGDGQFLVAAKWVKRCVFGMSEELALSEIYGVDIRRDNVEICRRRLGGGVVIHGDALNPQCHLNGQSEEDRHHLRRIFCGAEDQASLF